MLPYIVVFSLSIFLYKCSLKSVSRGLSKICLLLCILVPSLLVGFRDESLGLDWRGYGIEIWKIANHIDRFADFLSVYTAIESGYKLINYAVAHISGNCHVFFFFHQLILISIAVTIAYMYREHRNSEYILLFYFLYLFNPSINILRQSIAMMISFLAYVVWDKKYFKVSYTLSAVACLFHFSAIIAFCIYILSKQKYFFMKYKQPILLFLLFFFLSNSSLIMEGSVYSNALRNLIDLNIVSGHYTGYIDQSGLVSIHKTDIAFLIGVMLFVMIGPIKERNKETCAQIMVLALVAFFLNLLGNVTDIAFRVAYYFVIPISILISRVSSRNEENQKACILFSVLLALRLIYFAYSNGAENTIPYSSVILGI